MHGPLPARAHSMRAAAHGLANTTVQFWPQIDFILEAKLLSVLVQVSFPGLLCLGG